MRREKRLPELLCPAGDMAALNAAIAAGADAVYVGGKRFGARAYAKNFDIDELRQAVKLCHIAGVRLYVTLNTLIYDKELPEALRYAEELYAMGVDALIVCDLGFIRLVRERVPQLRLHASTQMGIHNTYGADMAASLGCERVVLARECSARDIRTICEKCLAEVEIFVHGALCVCHSGQCLFSSMVGGRSGNRGECAQPCRLPFGKNKYPLSLADMALAAHIPEIIDSGVSSLKIEGRMKSAEYVYTVTKIYRRLLDEGRPCTAEELRELERAFTRGGFTDGYYTARLGSGMTGVRSEADKNATRELKVDIPRLPKMKLSCTARLVRGEPSSLRLTCHPVSSWGGIVSEREISASAVGEIPSDALNAPLTEEGVKARLSKMGATPFELSSLNIDLTLDEGINLSPSAINGLRRSAAELLEAEFAKPIYKLCPESDGGYKPASAADASAHAKVSAPADSASIGCVAVFRESSLFLSLLENKNAHMAKIDLAFLPLWGLDKLTRDRVSSIEKGGIRLGAILPAVISESELDSVKQMLTSARELGIEALMLGNIGHIPFAAELGFLAFGDTRLNIMNSESRALYKELGVADAALSCELTLPQARDIGGFILSFGRVPLMITERCFIKENFGCDMCGRARLTDRRGAKFPIIREYNHRNIILNSALTYMGDRIAELDKYSLGQLLYFSCESESEAAGLLDSYFGRKPLNCDIRRIGKRQITD